MARQFATLREIATEARLSVSPRVWDYLEGGANGETSLQENGRVFDEHYFLPRMLAGITRPDLRSSLFGVETTMPVFLSPFGFDMAVHPDGFAGVARAAHSAGLTTIVSESSTGSIEEIAAASEMQGGAVQRALIGPKGDIVEYAERAKSAGYTAVCFTDVPTSPWRERLFESPLDFMGRWGLGNYGPGKADPAVLDEIRTYREPRWNWDRLAALADELPLPFVLKGVLRGEDADRAIEAGASGVYLSNFGGRNLDGICPPASRLAEVAEAVNGRVPVLLDSGVRRGTDIVKALALGATAVGVGRLAAYGLAADGESGVAETLRLLRAEVESAVGALGCSSVRELSADYLLPAR